MAKPGTLRYLGVEVDDALEMAEQCDNPLAGGWSLAASCCHPTPSFKRLLPSKTGHLRFIRAPAFGAPDFPLPSPRFARSPLLQWC
ncbi:hypothetical protein D2917_22165 [Cupriavidus oxalaticus]|uniref:Uncharacterized protein n=1 Tax=Cupriavidus oxalaticus TaxID=96344 RepID=A0A5P3VLT3_9BURK|nr:hypothetical protein D2917_22165 [Cupriavidus oxalaticus]